VSSRARASKPSSSFSKKARQLAESGITSSIPADLGRPEDIGRLFAGFQKYLYEKAA
jgi:hypothetical protein